MWPMWGWVGGHNMGVCRMRNRCSFLRLASNLRLANHRAPAKTKVDGDAAGRHASSLTSLTSRWQLADSTWQAGEEERKVGGYHLEWPNGHGP